MGQNPSQYGLVTSWYVLEKAIEPWLRPSMRRRSKSSNNFIKRAQPAEVTFKITKILRWTCLKHFAIIKYRFLSDTNGLCWWWRWRYLSRWLRWTIIMPTLQWIWSAMVSSRIDKFWSTYLWVSFHWAKVLKAKFYFFWVLKYRLETQAGNTGWKTFWEYVSK